MDLPGLWAAAPQAAGEPASTPFASPGFMLYVTATLLPLLSFLCLFLIGGVRNYCRPFRDKADWRASFFKMLHGDDPARGSAWIATTAIACSFGLSLVGFILYAVEHQGHGGHDHGAATAHEHGHGDAKKTDEKHDDHAKKDEHAGTVAPVAHDQHRWVDRLEWIRLGSWTNDPRGGLALELGYKIDHLSTIMFLMVTFIATLIHLFSIGYMSDELEPMVEDHHVHTEDGHLRRRGRFRRFFMYLSLFCFSMLNLILADNLFQIFISWELVGICSYLLIGFYYERQSASDAANKAFITNRVGDAGFIIGLLVIWTYVGTLNIDEIFARLRSPVEDAHGTIPLAGQFVRGRIDQQASDGQLEVLAISRPDEVPGDLVVLFPIEQSGHFHGLGYGRSHLHEEAYPEQDRNWKKIVTAADWNWERDAASLPASRNLTKFGYIPYWLLVVAGLGIFLGCVGKSAQFPLHVWLPDAMEGPTPVSALIHAATMVAAGVYLVGRVYPLFTPEARLVIAYTGGITLFVAATTAIVMTDIKKVLAYSTVSQLGYMMLALGVGGWAAGLFHLLTHAFFKALLFLGSGSVIYGCHHEQEMTKMGGLFKKMPITALTMLAGVLAIAGTPLFTGWYSKDAILVASYGFVRIHQEHVLLFLLPLLTAGITTFYMFRMWFMTFTGEPRDHHVHEHAHESPRLMTIPLILLGICSVCVAWGWPLWDAEASALEGHLHHSQHHAVWADFGSNPGVGEPMAFYREGKTERLLGAHELVMGIPGHLLVGLLALGSAGLGFLFTYVVYLRKALDPAESKEQFAGVYDFLAHKWYFDEFYSVAFVRPALQVAHWCRWFDANVIDGVAHFLAWFIVFLSRWDGLFDKYVIDGAANLLAKVTQGVAGWFRTWQTGQLRNYVLFLVLAAISLFAILRWFVGLASAGN